MNSIYDTWMSIQKSDSIYLKLKKKKQVKNWKNILQEYIHMVKLQDVR